MLLGSPERRPIPVTAEGDREPHLEVGARIAVGGMAEIFEATLDGVPVVLKRALPGADAYRTDAEAAALAAISSPHVVALIGRHADGIVLERLNGPTLGTALASAARHGRALSLAALAALVDQLLLGLHDIHEATDPSGAPLGLLHRDLSPSNVLFGDAGRVVLCDLGLARATALAATTVAGIKGTLGYMAPEQLRAEPAAPETDVFAAGLLIYEAATGVAVRPHTNAGIAELLAMRSRLPSPPSGYRPELPPGVDAALLIALAPDRATRYGSAMTFRHALLAALPAPDAAALAAWAMVAEPGLAPLQATVDGAAGSPLPAAPTVSSPRAQVPPSAPISSRSRATTVTGWAIAALGMGLVGTVVWPRSATNASGGIGPAIGTAPSTTLTAVTDPRLSVTEPAYAPDRAPTELSVPLPRRLPAFVALASSTEARGAEANGAQPRTDLELETRAASRRPARDRRTRPSPVDAVTTAPRWHATISSLGGPLHVTGAGAKGLAPIATVALDHAELLTLVAGPGAKVVLRLEPTGRGLRARIGAPPGQYWDIACAARPAAPSPVTLSVERPTTCTLTRDALRVAFTLTAVAE